MKIRRKKVRVKISLIALATCTVSFVLFLFSSLFLRTYNVTLSKKIQSNNSQITQLRMENDTLALEVQQLSSYDRVMAIAEEDGMSLKQSNIITVVAESN